MYGHIICCAVLHDSALLLDSASDSKTDYTRDTININFIYWALKWNVIPQMKTYGSWGIRCVNGSPAAGLRWVFFFSTRAPSRPFRWLSSCGKSRPSGGAADAGCRRASAVPPWWHPPHYPAESMLGNWNAAEWAVVQHVLFSMGLHYPKQKQRAMLNNRFVSRLLKWWLEAAHVTPTSLLGVLLRCSE